MRSRPDYPIINPVESVLISNKLPTKLFASTTPLVESKHEDHPDSYRFVSPAEDSLKKLDKICPLNPMSVGSDPNANLRAFVIIILENAFNSQDDFYEKLFLDKITNQLPNLILTAKITNHTHEEMAFENIVKVVSGFLKTLSNKKLKSPQTFDLLKQLETLSIILDYSIIIFRAILDHYGQQNANNFTKFVQDNESYTILSEYFDINLIRKDSFYLFEENRLFIYKGANEYVFGRYQSMGSQQIPKQKTGTKIQSKYEQKNCGIQIMQCSMESGSMMISSRHAEESTPNFSPLNGQQLAFKLNERKQPDAIKESKQLHEIDQNTKYKSGNRSENSKHHEQNSEKVHKDGSFSKFQKKRQNKLFINNNSQNSKKISPIKKVSSDKCFNPFGSSEVENRQKTDSLPAKKSNQNTEVTKEKELSKDNDNTIKQNASTAPSNDHHFNQMKAFAWQNDERRLRRVETICYKTCSTCHRRFYRNEIQSGVFEVRVTATPKLQESKTTPNQKTETVTPKHTPEFLNKKFSKKAGEGHAKIQSPRVMENSPRHNLKDVGKPPQLAWLSKRIKTESQNQEGKMPQSTNRQENSVNFDSFHASPFKSDPDSPKKVLNTKNMFTKGKQGKEGLNSSDQEMTKMMSSIENTRPSGDKREAERKLKSFFTLKSQKELEKIKSIDKYDFFKGKISKDGVFTNQKTMNSTATEMRNMELARGATSLGKMGKGANFGEKVESMDRKGVATGGWKEEKWKKEGNEKSKIDESRSVERRIPNFVKKDSLNTALDMILNN